jgi:hypothetical protein
VSGEGWRRAAATLVVAVACYANTLGNDLVWDDRLGPAVAGDAGAAALARTGAYYRPLVMLSLVADRLAGGGSSVVFHATNLLAHASVAWLVGTLVRALGAGPTTALVASLLFVAHPLQTEAVSYVSGRTDVLCAAFALAALLAWRRAERPFDGAALATAVLVLAALGCKETALLVPLVLLVPGANPRVPPPRPWAALGVTAVWAVAWAAASGGSGGGLGGVAPRLPAIAAALLTHVRLLIWPGDLHLERFVPVAGWSAGTALAMWLAVVVLGVGLVRLALVVSGGLVLLAFAVATYLPASGVVPVYPAIADRALFAAEHFTYLPLCGLVPLVVGAAARVLSARVLAGVAALVLAAWVPLVVARNRDWRDEETLFRHTLRYAPPAARVWYDLANLRLAAGDPVEAERLYRDAIARAPRDGAIHLNLGIALQRQGRRADAQAEYEAALRLDPSLARAFQRPP